MTYKSFIEALSKTRGWRLTSSGAIRKGTELTVCPIVAVAKRKGCHYAVAANALGLTWELTEDIAIAADDIGSSRIRRDLMRACRLEEPWE